MSQQNILKIVLVSITILFILILTIKRFAYFRPTYDFVQPRDTYIDIYEGNLHAWYKKGSSGKVILFCHGNAGNLSYRQEKLMEISKMGHSVLIFDYSGFGQSKGVPNEELCYANSSLFVDNLFRLGYRKENIIPYGESLGASVAVYTARKYNLNGVIIESGLPGVKYLIKSWHPILTLFCPLFDEFNTVNYLKGYKGKVFIVHCINDDIVPYKVTEEMRKYATVQYTMTGNHNNPNIPWIRVKEFINNL